MGLIKRSAPFFMPADCYFLLRVSLFLILRNPPLSVDFILVAAAQV